MTLSNKQVAILKVPVFALSLLPAILLTWQALHNQLGANPIEFVTHSTGRWILKFLLITLAITPLRKITGWNWLIRFRRLFGLFAFFYSVLHFITYIWLDKFFDMHEIWVDVLKRRFITVGFAAFVLLIPLAVTSTTGMIRRMGKRWGQLHRLIYLIAVLGIVHFIWLVKQVDIFRPLQYGALVLLVLGWRVGDWIIRKAKAKKKIPPQAKLPTPVAG